MEILLDFYVILIGLVLGSFIALAAVRLPQGKSIIKPRSHCPHCQHQLRSYENIPVLSYFFLAGKCSQCKNPISLIYPLIELFSAFVIFLTYLYVQPLPRFFLYACLFATPMLILTITDWKHLILPNVITLPGILFAFILHALDQVYFFQNSSLISAMSESLIGALAGAIPLFLIAYFYIRVRGKEGLGMGDVKLAAMIGACFGWKEMYFILLLASVSGAFYGVALMIVKKNRRDTPLPLGSFLALSSIVFLFWGDKMLEFYLGTFREFLLN